MPVASPSHSSSRSARWSQQGSPLVGPAVPERAVYTWPPTHLPDAKPTRTWFAPLFVARQDVESFDATVPCGGPLATLPGAGRRRRAPGDGTQPGTNHALGVTWSRATGSTSVRIGRTVVAEVPAGSARLRAGSMSVSTTTPGRFTCRTGRAVAGRSCLRRRSSGSSPSSTWPRSRALDGDRPAVCAGHASEHAADAPPPACGRAAGGRARRRLRALALEARGRIRQISRRASRPRRTASCSVSPLSGGYSPLCRSTTAGFEARQVNSLVSGGFSNYYDDYGANLPLATWYEWIQHFVMTGTDSLGVHRLFSAVFVVATWFVARWCLVELTGRRPSRADTHVVGGRRGVRRSARPPSG